MAEVVEGYDCVVEVGWRWIAAVFCSTMALAPAPTGEGCRQYTVILRALPVLYRCVVYELQCIEQLLIFS
jgi:hypothetical protein